MSKKREAVHREAGAFVYPGRDEAGARSRDNGAYALTGVGE